MKAVMMFFMMCSIACAGDIMMKPNNFGGYNFYNGGKKIGHSRSSNFGGQKFYDNRGRMGHFYGNPTGNFNYRGNANLGPNKGAVFSGLRRNIPNHPKKR